MIIERSGFLLMAGVLAAGGVGGWALRDNGVGEKRALLPPASPVVTPATAFAKAMPTSVAVVDVRALAAECDDSVGAAEECPSLGPADEGLCANVLAKRCADFKASFKPKVAEDAVACLLRLSGNERCDSARINLCGHSALMAACPTPAQPIEGNYVNATVTTPASFTLEDSKAAPSAITKDCESMSQSCSDAALAPSVEECERTLAGMNESGRRRTLDCVAAHCEDRGLVGCEAMPSDTGNVQSRR